MSGRKRRFAKLFGLPVLAAAGFLVAATLAAGGFAWYSSSSSSTTSTTYPTTTTHPTTTTTPSTTTAPPGNEGCTPGFWKNHPEDWVGYSPSQTIGSVFTSAPASISGLTLLEGLNLGGGGINALTRHAIAALLNAASPGVDYPLTTTQVINMVNAAYASGDYESLKDVLESYNELTAPGFCD